MDLFLFNRILQGMIKTPFTSQEFLRFTISDDLVTTYEQSWQLDQVQVGISIYDGKDIDKEYNDWNTSNKSLREDLLRSYQPHFEQHILSMEQFKALFPEDPKQRVCHYTHLSDHDFDELRKKGGIKTKNGRGRYMEIDRLNSNKEYFFNNIVLCCYWANNAKMDEFTEPEFSSSVGPAMEAVFRKRMNSA